ncbi:hypothetical protein [Burkholderia phage FLC10]|uniref:transcriptional repressor n=1 Tax=Burkholderia phage FLC10 TaxID=2906468 RepID=UPI0023290A9E|nr:transcriptional repressor [Burkholderia phage FLC10]BDD79955.1 hypothetical protein [Burkholderia phage FLC10]
MSVSKRPPLKRPASEAELQAFIGRAPDAKEQAAIASAAPATVAAPTPAKPARVVASSTRKQPISLTIDAGILARIDDAAAARGLSRAAAIADACADWLKSKEGA